MPTRRSTLLAGLAGLAVRPALIRPAQAQAPIAPSPAPAMGELHHPFTLPPLPYAFGANEPHVDAATMELHHDKHHAAYVANLNAAVKDYPAVAAMPLSAMLANLSDLPEAIRSPVRNNGGGHAWHSMFWTVMGGTGGAPSGALAAAVARDFGGIDQLRAAFNRAGVAQFGSGWAAVLVDRQGKLTLETRPNQDSVLMTGMTTGKRVLFGNDVWEHAYYLKYQNRRPDYLAAWWNVVNWPAVEQRFAAAQAGTLVI